MVTMTRAPVTPIKAPKGSKRKSTLTDNDEDEAMPLACNIEALIAITPLLCRYLTAGEALYSLASMHPQVTAKVYSRGCLKVIFPARRSIFKVLADHSGDEHIDVRRIRSILRKPSGRSLLWQLLVRENGISLDPDKYIEKWSSGYYRPQEVITCPPDLVRSNIDGRQVKTDYTREGKETEARNNDCRPCVDQDVILKDLSRTFTKNPDFTSRKFTGTLFRMLYTNATRNDQSMGYCQGFNVVAANLIIHMHFPRTPNSDTIIQLFRANNPRKEIDHHINQELMKSFIAPLKQFPDPIGQEEEFFEAVYSSEPELLRREVLACQCLLSMVRMLDLDLNLYTRDLYGMTLKCKVLSHLCETHLPKVKVHLEKLGLPDLSFFACNWFITLFAEPCQKADSNPVDATQDKYITGIWEQFLLRGWKVLFRTALTILQELQEELLASTDIGEVTQILSDPFGHIERMWAKSSQPAKMVEPGTHQRIRLDPFQPNDETEHPGSGLSESTKLKKLSASWILRHGHEFKVTNSIIAEISDQLKLKDEKIKEHLSSPNRQDGLRSVPTILASSSEYESKTRNRDRIRRTLLPFSRRQNRIKNERVDTPRRGRGMVSSSADPFLHELP